MPQPRPSAVLEKCPLLVLPYHLHLELWRTPLLLIQYLPLEGRAEVVSCTSTDREGDGELVLGAGELFPVASVGLSALPRDLNSHGGIGEFGAAHKPFLASLALL